MPNSQSSFEILRKSLRGGFMTKYKGETASCAAEAGFATSALAVSFPNLALSAAVALTLGMGLGVTDASAQVVEQYWDGSNTSGNNVVDGGSGTWDAGTTNWTDVSGAVNLDYDVNGGTLVFSGAAGTVTVSGAQTLSEDIQFSTDGYDITGDDLNITGTRTFTVSPGQATITSSIVGTGNLTKVGDGTLVLAGTNTYIGNNIVNAGTLKLATGTSIGADGNNATISGSNTTLDLGGNTVNVNQFIAQNGATIENGTLSQAVLIQLGGTTFDAVLAGAGELRQISNTSTLNGVNTYTGATNVNGGTLNITGSITSTDISVSGSATLSVDEDALAAGANVDVTNSGTLQINGDNKITSLDSSDSGTVFLDSGTLTVTGGGTIAGSGGVTGIGGLTNDGGTLTLGGANSATGTLTNTAGTIVANNGAGWSGSVVNNATFELAGSAVVGGDFTNASGATLINTTASAQTLTGITTFTSAGTVNGGVFWLGIGAVNVTLQDGHSDSGAVSYTVSSTLRDQRTGGVNFSNIVAPNYTTEGTGTFATCGGLTLTGAFTQNSSGLVTITGGETFTASSITNSAGSGGIFVGANATLQGTATRWTTLHC